MGSVIVGTRALIERAIRLRKVLGGGMRQSGVLAAAGLYALDHNMARLAQDHRHASDMAEVINQVRRSVSEISILKCILRLGRESSW